MLLMWEKLLSPWSGLQPMSAKLGKQSLAGKEEKSFEADNFLHC